MNYTFDQLRQLSDSDLSTILAELLGWHTANVANDIYMRRPGSEQIAERPAFASDLNAIAGVEDGLTDAEWLQYIARLERYIPGLLVKDPLRVAIHLSARTKTICLILTLQEAK